MVDTLSAFADEVTRVAREVGTEGILGGQAQVPNVAGTWKDLTDNVNSMAGNLTSQVRNIAQVTTAVAKGDLTKKIDVDARGEILELKTTINTMVDQLSSFAAEVTRVAREVGTEGRLGGQAEVEGVSGTWKRLTENVNELASNLTTPGPRDRRGDHRGHPGRPDPVRSPSRPQGEVAELKDNINQMIDNLRETTRANQEQDWLKTNLARITGLMQGHRDLLEVAELIMSELTPLVAAQYGAFFLAEDGARRRRTLRLDRVVRLPAAPGRPGHASRSARALVGQAARERRADPGHRRARPTTSRSPPGSGEALAARRSCPADACSRTRCSASSSWRRSPRSPRCTCTSSTSSWRPSASRSTRSSPTPAPRSCSASRSGSPPSCRTSRRSCRPSRRSCSRPTPSSRRRRAAGPAEPRHRDQEPRDRARPPGAGGPRRAARAVVAVQVRVPREHVPRAAHAAELPAHPRQAARRERRRQPHREQVEFAQTIHSAGHRPAPADQRHPRPVQGRGRARWTSTPRRSPSPGSSTTSRRRSGRSPRRRT